MVSDTWIPVEPDEMPPAAAALFDNFFEVFKLIVEDTCSKSDPELVKKVNAFSKIRNEKMAPIHVPSKDGFNCIVHNDSWCNNFMFK